jgi:hypothetical protein
VVEDEREGKVEDETRASDERVQIPYAAEKSLTNEGKGADGDVLCAERDEPAKRDDPTPSRVKAAVPMGVRPFLMANMHAPAPYTSERVPPLRTAQTAHSRTASEFSPVHDHPWSYKTTSVLEREWKDFNESTPTLDAPPSYIRAVGSASMDRSGGMRRDNVK